MPPYRTKAIPHPVQTSGFVALQRALKHYGTPADPVLAQAVKEFEQMVGDVTQEDSAAPAVGEELDVPDALKEILKRLDEMGAALAMLLENQQSAGEVSTQDETTAESPGKRAPNLSVYLDPEITRIIDFHAKRGSSGRAVQASIREIVNRRMNGKV